MTLELIIFVASILFGILLYWRESKSNKVYRFFNKLMYSKDLQMKSDSKKGFIFQQNFLLRLVYITVLFLVAIIVVQFILPISASLVQWFVSAIVGTLIGTYLANFILKSSDVIGEKSESFEDVLNESINKGKEFIDDLKTKDTKVVEEAKKEIKEEPKKEEKSARERLKDKGLM